MYSADQNCFVRFFYYLSGQAQPNTISASIRLNKYSLIFNLFLNVVDIKEDWSYCISNCMNGCATSSLLNDTFDNYYHCSFLNSKNFSVLDAYRIFISLLFKYYNNFLYKLSRYLYILNKKDYTLMKFIKRYFNFKSWYGHFYIKFRVMLNTTHLFGKSLENKFYKKLFIKRKNKFAGRVRRIEIAPFWFVFYKYIKMFVYFLLNKYYTKGFMAK
jgi:hypothetical protein